MSRDERNVAGETDRLVPVTDVRQPTGHISHARCANVQHREEQPKVATHEPSPERYQDQVEDEHRVFRPGPVIDQANHRSPDEGEDRDADGRCVPERLVRRRERF